MKVDRFTIIDAASYCISVASRNREDAVNRELYLGQDPNPESAIALRNAADRFLTMAAWLYKLKDIEEEVHKYDDKAETAEEAMNNIIEILKGDEYYENRG